MDTLSLYETGVTTATGIVLHRRLDDRTSVLFDNVTMNLTRLRRRRFRRRRRH